MKDCYWNELDLAGIEFGKNSKGPLLLMFHGWLDNAASFEFLIPLLEENYAGYAVDLPGHGFSKPFSHHSYHVSDVLLEMKALIEFLDRDVILIGHSLGAGLCSLLASTRLARVKGLVLIDGIGLMTESSDKSAQRLKRAINMKLPRKSYYKTRGEALNRRKDKTGLSEKIIQALASRGLQEKEDGFSWSHDRAWLRPSPHYYTEDAMRQIMENIEVPVLVIEGEGGLIANKPAFKARVSCLANGKSIGLPGGHYPHAYHPEKTATVLKSFISQDFHES